MVNLDDYNLPIDANIPTGRSVQIGNGVERHLLSHDKGVAFKFDIWPVYNEVRSKACKPECEMFDNIEIIQFFNDEFTHPVLMVTDYHREKYKEAYERWQKGLEAPGTALSKWEVLTPADVMTLQKNNIHSVEQFAAITKDRIATKYPKAFVEFHSRAVQYVNARQGLGDVEETAKQVVTLKQANADLLSRLEALEAKNSLPKKRGKAKAKAPGLQTDEVKED